MGARMCLRGLHHVQAGDHRGQKRAAGWLPALGAQPGSPGRAAVLYPLHTSPAQTIRKTRICGANALLTGCTAEMKGPWGALQGELCPRVSALGGLDLRLGSWTLGGLGPWACCSTRVSSTAGLLRSGGGTAAKHGKRPLR